MTVDLVSVEVGIVTVAVGVVHSQRLLSHVRQHASLMGHYAWLVQRRLSKIKYANSMELLCSKYVDSMVLVCSKYVNSMELL